MPDADAFAMMPTQILLVALGLAAAYLTVTLALTWVVQKFPRKPVSDPPDWGKVTDAWVSTAGRGRLEVWKIEPEGHSAGTVVLVHGWGRNRDRMVSRARLFGRWGYTAVLFSARDHGRSSRVWVMNAYKFSEDIESVLNWIGEPVVLYGHSAGSAGAILAAHRNPHRIRALILEGSYPRTRPALLSLYRWFHPAFGKLFGPMIVFCMNAFYRGGLDRVDPARLAPDLIMPVLVIHGENDRRFPAAFARELHASFTPGTADLFIAPGAGHSESSLTPGYPLAVKAFLDAHV